LIKCCPKQSAPPHKRSTSIRLDSIESSEFPSLEIAASSPASLFSYLEGLRHVLGGDRGSWARLVLLVDVVEVSKE